MVNRIYYVYGQAETNYYNIMYNLFHASNLHYNNSSYRLETDKYIPC